MSGSRASSCAIILATVAEALCFDHVAVLHAAHRQLEAPLEILKVATDKQTVRATVAHRLGADP